MFEKMTNRELWVINWSLRHTLKTSPQGGEDIYGALLLSIDKEVHARRINGTMPSDFMMNVGVN